MNSKTFRATAVLVGAVIGAGIFGLPYVINQIGFLPGLIYLFFLAGMVLLLNLLYGEVVLRTAGDHQLSGYAAIYLGGWGKLVATLAIFVSAYGALLAYLIKTGEFLNLIFPGTSPVIFSLFFFVCASTALFFGLRSISFLEGLLVSLLLALIGLLSLLGIGEIQLAHFSPPNLDFLFLPYGVILFAFFGASVIPEMEEILRSQPEQLKKAIVWGSLIPLLVYLLFSSVVVGISGPLTSDDAISGLIGLLPDWIVHLGAFLGVLTMTTSYLALGYVLREVWFRDFQLARLAAFVLAILPAWLLFLAGAKNFIQVLGITGALMGGLEGVLIIVLFHRAQKVGQRQPAYSLRLPSFLLAALAMIFLIGMFSPLFS